MSAVMPVVVQEFVDSVVLNFRCDCGCECLLERSKAEEGEIFPCPEQCGAEFVMRYGGGGWQIGAPEKVNHRHIWGPHGCWCGATEESEIELELAEIFARKGRRVKGSRREP